MTKMTKKNEEKQLVWKLAEKPSGHVVAELVANGVIDKEEARAILFREETRQSDEVEALKEMVKTLQEMVKDLLSRQNNIQLVPYTKVIEVSPRYKPYWDNAWMSSGSTWGATTSTTTGNGTTVYRTSLA